MPSGVIVASAPPAMKPSASPNLMMRHASPRELFAVAQAVTMHMFGPRKSCSMEIIPLAMFEIIIAMVKGETREGPRSARRCASSSML